MHAPREMQRGPGRVALMPIGTITPESPLTPVPHDEPLLREIVPSDVSTWADLCICYAGHELVYRFLDSAERLLYVGVTWNPKERWKRHRKTKSWFTDTRSVAVQCYPSDDDALRAETLAIKNEAPLYNIHQAVR